MIICLTLSILISVILVRQYYTNKIRKLKICKFNNACTKYNKKDTSEALKRVIQLIISDQDTSPQYDLELQFAVFSASGKRR